MFLVLLSVIGNAASAACTVRLSSPAANASATSAPTFQWSATGDCRRFQVQVSPVSTFATVTSLSFVPTRNQAMTDETFDALATATGRLYFWRVQSVDGTSVTANTSGRRITLRQGDADDDGHLSTAISGGDDCDDTDPAINPGAVEVCNLVDDDCDTRIDEDEGACDDPGSCPEEEPADTGVVSADLSCASACDGCCAEDGTCLDGADDDACGVGTTCQDCTLVGDTCAEGTCQRVAWTSFSYHDDDEIDVSSIEDAARVRSDALRFIYGEPSIPTDLPTTVESDVASPLSGLVGLDHVDRLTMGLSDGFTSVAYVFRPAVSNGKLMIFHQGHSASYGADGGLETVDYFLEQGWDVVAMCMPLYGECSGPYASHGEMYLSSFGDYSYLRFFLEPVAQVVNYGEDVLGATEIDMIGISGGGWTTTLAAALDPRIRLSIPVAGSLPIYLRSDAADLGDAEQYGYEFYRIVGYPDLYVLGSIGPARGQLQVLNRYDSCCFAGTLYQDYEADVAAAVASIAPGGFSVFLDQSHTSHQISTFALNAAIGPFVDGGAVTIVDDIGPEYGAFQLLGPWRSGSDAGSFAGRHREVSVEGATATWSYLGEPGEYRVSATWGGASTLGSAVPYSVTGDSRVDVTVDQTSAPTEWTDASAAWQDLATAAVTSTGALTVSVEVPAGTTVRADAVRFERLCTACTWFADADGDGHGDAGSTRLACTGGDGWVGTSDDCDDTRSDVHPAAEETPANGVDEDCDGGDATPRERPLAAVDSAEEPVEDTADAPATPPVTKDPGNGCGCGSESGGAGVGVVLGGLVLTALRGKRRATP